MPLYILCHNIVCFEVAFFFFLSGFDKIHMVGDTLDLQWEKWEIKFKIPLLQYFFQK